MHDQLKSIQAQVDLLGQEVMDAVSKLTPRICQVRGDEEHCPEVGCWVQKIRDEQLSRIIFLENRVRMIEAEFSKLIRHLDRDPGIYKNWHTVRSDMVKRIYDLCTEAEDDS